MKLKLFQWLSTSLVLLAATRPVTAGDWCPYTAQGVTSTYTSYFELNHCPFPACGSEHVRSSHFLGHLGEILPNATYIQVDQPEVTFNGSTFSGDLLISFGTRYWEFSMHQQGVKQWSNFRPTQFKVEWTVYAGQGTLAQVTGGKVPVWTKSGSESYPAVSSLGSGAGNKCTIIWDGSCNVNRSYKVPLDEIARKLKISSTNTEPVYFYVSFTVTPDGWVENGYKIEEGGYSCNVRNYLRPHTVTSSWSSTVAQSACKLRFRYHVSQFSFNTYEGNAILNTGNGEHAVVYNDPRSEISFVVTVGQGNNLPISKIVNSKRATPAVFMVTGTQPALWSQDPHSNIQTYKSWPDGMADAWSCDYNMGSASPSSLIRKRNVVLNTNGAVLVDSIGKPLPISQRYNPALITIDATQDGRSLQLDRCLKDFSYTGNAIKDGSIFYVGMKALYSTTSSSLYKEPYLMSYVNGGSVSPGVAISLGSIYSIADYESVPSSNVVSFEVLPAVSFPPLPLSEVEEHKVCETEGFSLETEADYIHLRGRRIVSPKYSETLYQPLYGWQFSYDKKVWNNVEESECGFSPSSLPYTINYNNELDALVHGSILRKRERVYFRQYCVLKSFYSKHRKEGFYDYKVDCGDETRYYLQVYDEQVIT